MILQPFPTDSPVENPPLDLPAALEAVGKTSITGSSRLSSFPLPYIYFVFAIASMLLKTSIAPSLMLFLLEGDEDLHLYPIPA